MVYTSAPFPGTSAKRLLGLQQSNHALELAKIQHTNWWFGREMLPERQGLQYPYTRQWVYINNMMVASPNDHGRMNVLGQEMRSKLFCLSTIQP